MRGRTLTDASVRWRGEESHSEQGRQPPMAGALYSKKGERVCFAEKISLCGYHRRVFQVVSGSSERRWSFRWSRLCVVFCLWHSVVSFILGIHCHDDRVFSSFLKRELFCSGECRR